MTITYDQADSKIFHAKDFGINPADFGFTQVSRRESEEAIRPIPPKYVEKFQQTLKEHIEDPNTKRIVDGYSFL